VLDKNLDRSRMVEVDKKGRAGLQTGSPVQGVVGHVGFGPSGGRDSGSSCSKPFMTKVRWREDVSLEMRMEGFLRCMPRCYGLVVLRHLRILIGEKRW